MEFLLLLVVSSLILACFAVPVARSKGFDPPEWFFLCLIFGIFGAFALACKRADENELTRRRIRDGLSKICPGCAEAVRAPASICPHCRTRQPLDLAESL